MEHWHNGCLNIQRYFLTELFKVFKVWSNKYLKRTMNFLLIDACRPVQFCQMISTFFILPNIRLYLKYFVFLVQVTISMSIPWCYGRNSPFMVNYPVITAQLWPDDHSTFLMFTSLKRACVNSVHAATTNHLMARWFPTNSNKQILLYTSLRQGPAVMILFRVLFRPNCLTTEKI